ncbi:MAG: alpha/beta hydrolase [Gemmataceae bacterium]
MRSSLCLAVVALVLATRFARADAPADVLDKAPSKFAKSSDVKVHYKSLGEGTTAVVFIHGWCCDHTVWRDQAPALSSKVRTLYIDLPGYGLSDKPKMNYTMDVFANAVDVVLRDAGVERATLVGHSMGTPVVRQCFRRFPAKTKALVFVDGALRPYFKTPADAEPFLSRFKEETFRTDAPRFLMGMLPADAPALRDHIAKLVANAGPQAAISSFHGMVDPKIWTDDPVNVPAQALMAKLPQWTPEYKEYVKKLVPGLDYREFDGVGHFLFMEKPKEVNAALVEFLTKQGVVK